MRKKFLTNLSLLLFLNLLVKPIWIFGIDRNVQNVVGDEYGFYFAILNFSFLFNILLDLGITSFNNRNIAQNNQLLNKHFSQILVLKFLLAIFYFVITFIIAIIIGYEGRQLFFVALLGFNQFLISLILYFRSNISGLLMFKTESFLSVLDRIIMIIFCSALLWGNFTHEQFRIEWFIYVHTFAYLVTALIAFFIVKMKSSFKKLGWNRLFFIMILKKSFPFALLVLLMTFYNRIDSVMIERLLGGDLGEQQATVYASAFRLLDAVNMVAFLFAVLLLPIFSKMIKNGEPVGQMAKLAFTLLITIAVIVAAGSYFFSYHIIDLLYIHHIEQASDVYKILMWGIIGTSTTYVFSTLLTANGSLKQLNIIAGTFMICSIMLNLFLIPRFLALGSAFASVFTQLMVASIQVMVAQYFFRFKINWKFLIQLVLFAGGVLLIGYFTSRMPFYWINNFIIMIAASLSLAAILGFLSIKELLHVIRNG